MAPPAPVAFHAPWFDEREVEAVRAALASQASGDGPIGRRVEARLAGLLAAHRVLLTTSGTHALELALLALGIGPGQEVVCPSFTFVSSANAVLRVGARPVFAEIEEETLGLDPGDVERRLTPRTAAILPVHYAGVAPDMAALLDLARRHGLRTIEDAAQGLASIIHQFDVSQIVVGLPRNMNGTLGEQAEKILKWIKTLEKTIQLPVATWDERLSTVGATRILLEADLSRKKRKKSVDKLAAAIILQGYLDHRRDRKDDSHFPD